MPELPDIETYVQALAARVNGRTLQAVRVASPFFLRSVQPGLDELRGHRVSGVRRMGKRIVIAVQPDFFLLFHLMIGGRLHWTEPERPARARGLALAVLDFDSGSLSVTEAGAKKRASLHVVRGNEALRAFDRGGVEVPACALAEFADALARENHTLKRALTDPALFSGIGNAYSDEILHRARLAPLALSRELDGDQVKRLFHAARDVLAEWTARLRERAGGHFPEGVTAFRPEMAVHGKFKKPCPVCGTAIQRIRYRAHENNYCPRCQTGGKVYADRALSRLLKSDWPTSIEEWENKLHGRRGMRA